MTEYQKYIEHRFSDGVDPKDIDDYKGLYDLEDDIDSDDIDDMFEFLKNTPNASLQDALNYSAKYFEPLEIVDDDELTEDERNDF